VRIAYIHYRETGSVYMDIEPNIIPLMEAARRKGCSGQALRNAIGRGDLNAIRIGRYTFIARDKDFEAYQVRLTGGRRHKKYQLRNQSD